MQIALLRGINVGGKNPVPMKALSDLFVEAGCQSVRTYIQSGNVLFNASAAVSKQVSAKVSAAIEKKFGCRVPILLRTAKELDVILKNNPFLRDGSGSGTTDEMLHVYFLAQEPTEAQTGQLDAMRSAPDAFAVEGREIYLRLPNGMARTKLTNAYFDSKLSTVSTARNWRTVKKLRELIS